MSHPATRVPEPSEGAPLSSPSTNILRRWRITSPYGWKRVTVDEVDAASEKTDGARDVPAMETVLLEHAVDPSRPSSSFSLFARFRRFSSHKHLSCQRRKAGAKISWKENKLLSKRRSGSGVMESTVYSSTASFGAMNLPREVKPRIEETRRRRTGLECLGNPG